MFLEKLNEVITAKRSFISDRLNFGSLALAGLINIIHWVILLLKIKPGSGNAVLHYNVIYGTDLVDKASLIYIIPGLALMLLVFNFTIARYIFKKEPLAAYFLNFSNILIQLIFLVASLGLVVINGS